MKKNLKFMLNLAILLSLVGGVASCAQDPPPTKQQIPISDSIIGEWEWAKTSGGGHILNPLTPENTGWTQFIIFTADSSWRKIKNQEIVEFGENFTIGTGFFTLYDDTIRHYYDSVLYFKNGMPIKTEYFSIWENNLTFCADFGGYIVGSSADQFKRIK
jgi:hypothetical protein